MNYQKLPFTASLLAAAITMTACSGGGNSSNSEPQDLPKDPGVTDPAPALPTYTMNMNGGDGVEGGDAGGIGIFKMGAAGAIRVSAEATIDPSQAPVVTVPEVPSDLGSNPLVISSDTTIDLSETTEPDKGAIYLYESGLYIFDGSVVTEGESTVPDLGKDSTRITGIQVNEGATLTFSTDTEGAPKTIEVEQDFINNGTITTTNPSTSRTFPLQLAARIYQGTGDIDQRGTAISIIASLVVNAGTIDASPTGLESFNGYNGINLVAAGVVNNGILRSEGIATNINGDGAEGGAIMISGFAVANNGTIDASNAAGSAFKVNTNLFLDDIGRTGTVALIAQYAVMNSGTIDVSGDNGSEQSSINGGWGGYAGIFLNPTNIDSIDIEDEELDSIAQAIVDQYSDSVSPILINTGSIVADGGDGAEDGNGGSAGYAGFLSGPIEDLFGDSVIFEAEEAETVSEEELPAPPVVFEVTGNLSLNGGLGGAAGGFGGNGGLVGFAQLAAEASTNDLHISGITAINAEGGDAASGIGGKGGNSYLTTGPLEQNEESEETSPVGPDIIFSTDINFNGGSSQFNGASSAELKGAPTMLFGAQGGSVDINSNIAMNQGTVAGTVNNIDHDSAPALRVYASGDILVSGSISATGAEVTASAALSEEEEPGVVLAAATSSSDLAGGNGAAFVAESESGNINLTADMDLSGGNGSNQGGDGSIFQATATEGTINISGNIIASGGNADPTIESSVGGDGGILTLNSDLGSDVSRYTVPTSLDLTAGTGETAGFDGYVRGYNIDLVEYECLFGNCLSLVAPRR
ncbi:MAG: hypothetical protein C9355_08440 [Thalassolituus maritimus]|uniref:Uncharacterized protein n=1 Tax=Thalassolituus maritimus TaxID=484498 RepID=A0A1N7QA79_9GAMM|nr:hypothetical protein [Thalassolituus maritimus]TPD54431.1 MAG: hypothetical protein C9355_08440 [Thalassolituus maritimus]SIT19741.1 hypothetical protein SAMN05421686_11711 [Thalassolituus maritimus]